MISKIISIDIVRYFQREKHLSVDKIAQSMDTSSEHIEDILESKQTFTSNNIDYYLKYSNLYFWEFAFAAIPLEHFPERVQSNIMLCKELSDHIKKKEKIVESEIVLWYNTA